MRVAGLYRGYILGLFGGSTGVIGVIRGIYRKEVLASAQTYPWLVGNKGIESLYEPWSKLLVSPLIAPLVVLYTILYNTLFKQFRLWLIYSLYIV